MNVYIGMANLSKVIILLLLMTGCAARFAESVTGDKSGIKGSLVTTRDLLITGYTLKVKKNSNIDGYAIYDFPGVSGPEVISESILPKGAIFEVVRIDQCSNCWPFPSYKRYIVNIKSTQRYTQAEVHFSDYVFSLKGDAWVEK